jgi:AbrB family looped-hinge helix DNA binding protein
MAEERSVVRLGPQGRLVIPASIRRRLGLAPGDEMTLRVEDESLVLEPRAAAAARAQGMFKDLSTEASVVDELIEERRSEARREARR